jgi:hypothetical protein
VVALASAGNATPAPNSPTNLPKSRRESRSAVNAPPREPVTAGQITVLTW